MNSQLIETYLEAENDIKNNNFVEAFRKYESILFEEPTNAATHNSLGWIYKSQMDDYESAEKHFLAAMKNNPAYPHSYLNYAALLMDMERFEELEALAKSIINIPVIEKSWLLQRLGMAQELKLCFEEAIGFYEKAILLTLNTDKIKLYEEDIERCQKKIELQKNYGQWTGSV